MGDRVGQVHSCASVFYKCILIVFCVQSFILETTSQRRDYEENDNFNAGVVYTPSRRPLRPVASAQRYDYDYDNGGGSFPPVRNNQNQPWWANGGQGNRPFQPTTTYSNNPQWWTERPGRPVATTTRRPPPTRPRPPPTTTRRTTTTRRANVWGDSAAVRPTTRRPPPPTAGVSNRISDQKCREYSKLVTSSVMALPLLPNADPITIEKPKCDFKGLDLIVGGTSTLPGEFPHMAAVGYRSNGKIDWDCGGSLISDFFIMTAAHCTATSKGEPYMVRLGELNLNRDDDGAQPTDYRIAQIIKHPDYKPPARYNDIALLRLVSQVKFNTHIRPACLYTQNTFTVNKTVATGWGRIEYAEDPSEVLLKVAINIIDSKTCNQLYRADTQTDRLRQGIVPTMLCAGDLNGGKDTCQGDSGGPIQITAQQNQCLFYVIGVTSFGKFCAAKNAPGVYTRVSAYIPWIESVVWPRG